MAATVYVTNIGVKTDDKEIKDFFSFCGKISSIEITPSADDTKSATVTFDKETASRTALLLNHTKLGGNEITVTAPHPPSSSTPTPPEDRANDPNPQLTQEEKPRSRILAELLAHGYVVADQGLQHAITLDEQHNLSSRFTSTLRQLDERTRATDRARTADASYGISARAGSLLTGLGSYFEKAKDTPTGKRIVGFYTTGQRQVQDIHNEAKRLAELKKEEAGGGLYKGWGIDRVMEKIHGSGSQEGEGKEEAAGAAATVIPPAAETTTTTTTTTTAPAAPAAERPEAS
ncbi:hypothetical protein C8A05DRAFT_38729 [Staphylotrichum tortipilum]|uniref:RRM domain-containing protein n=1 Tax=Staphylotrichum tortipilum TaxID=2831512 RepID=A0AAN6MBF3_9PEZI|nr:hypothetical protein C8A05DRAFT_38729 [Staphylotrichum longicolle]